MHENIFRMIIKEVIAFIHRLCKKIVIYVSTHRAYPITIAPMRHHEKVIKWKKKKREKIIFLS